MALIPEIDLVKILEFCFRIEVGRFSMKLGLCYRVFDKFTGTGFIITLEFLRIE
jgi:hypothetical protein